MPHGPTAISALLTFQAAQGSVPKAILLCLLTGIVELLMGILGLGFLVDFVSGPVASGFTSAVSLIIVSSQVKDLLGIKASGSTFLEIWKNVFADIHNISLWDTCLGVTCIAVLLILRIVATIKIDSEEGREPSFASKFINKFLWLFGTSRNAILVVVCGYIGYSFVDNAPFKLIGSIPAGLPEIQSPPLNIPGNATDPNSSGENFWEMIASMQSGLVVIPLIALMENIAICKTFANGKTVDATQELIAIGLGNIANSFVQGFPGTGSLSRSAVNSASGVRTPLGNLYTAALVILALMFFTPCFYYIPKATLAAIIIAAVVFMVEVRVVRPMWRTKSKNFNEKLLVRILLTIDFPESDLFIGMVTFFACLVLPLEIGIILGVGINMISILHSAARPKLTVETMTVSSFTVQKILRREITFHIF